MKFLHKTLSGEPRRSVFSRIDILLVIVVALLVTIAQNPMLDALMHGDTVAVGASTPRVDIIVNNGEQSAHFKDDRPGGG